jgi:hypothetical protein
MKGKNLIMLEGQIWLIGTTSGHNHYSLFIVVNGYLS